MNQEHQIVRQVQKAQGDSRAADQRDSPLPPHQIRNCAF